MDEKQLLRKKYKSIRDGLSREAKEYSRLICLRCAALPEFDRAKTVFLYFAKGSEVDLSPLAKLSLDMGKCVAYPLCHGEGAFGIMEPPVDAPLCNDSDGICFVPALAYDREGYRLGWGGGYYDRYLSAFVGTKVGVAYSVSVTDKLPRGKHDIKTDYIITESKVKRIIED